MTQSDRNQEQQDANVTQQHANAAQQTANENLAELIRSLTVAVEALTVKFRRKRISDAVLAVIVVAMLVLGGLFYLDTVARRQALQDLACFAVRLAPPGRSPTSDGIRERYHCPPFNPADVPSHARTSSPVPGASTSRPVSAPLPPRPSPSATALPPVVMSPTPRPAASLSRVRVTTRPPVAPVTRTRTTGPARPRPRPSPSRSTSSSGVVNQVVCPIVSIDLLCHR